jgi:hypothetical protein
MYRTSCMSCSCTCSFVKELQSLRRKLESSPDAAAEFSLIALINALKDVASCLKEGIHDAVLTTILSIGMWSCTKVQPCTAAARTAGRATDANPEL